MRYMKTNKSAVRQVCRVRTKKWKFRATCRRLVVPTAQVEKLLHASQVVARWLL